MRKAILAGFCIMVCSVSALAVTPVPEIDAGSMSSALALIGGGILILRARFRSK